MTAESLSAVAGVVLSLAFSYLPGLSDWFDKLPATEKRLTMAGVLFLVVLAVVGLSCFGWVHLATCDQPGLINLVTAYLAALVANQSAYLISPRRPSAPAVE